MECANRTFEPLFFLFKLAHPNPQPYANLSDSEIHHHSSIARKSVFNHQRLPPLASKVVSLLAKLAKRLSTAHKIDF